MTYSLFRRTPQQSAIAPKFYDAVQNVGSWGNARRGLSSLRAATDFIGASPAIGGGGTSPAGGGDPVLNTTPRSSPCAPCPAGCKTVTKNETYYARKTRQSASDIPVTMNRKIVKCEDVSSLPRTSCQDEIARIRAQYGLSGLSGCSSCSGGYSNRM